MASYLARRLVTSVPALRPLVPPALHPASAPRSLGASFLQPALHSRHFALQAGGLPRLRFRGLPYTATTAEIRAFLTGFRLAESGERGGAAVELLRGMRGRPSGQAFAYFEDATEAMRAKDALHRRPWSVQGTSVYRVEVLEDFQGRVLVSEEDSPGDVTEERLRDKARKSMVGNKYRDAAQRKEVLYRQW
mmetsp:Transcript_159676/g.512369  ORF Transcript_159676/g.512369 Transcript_159676/m.512369 type:complete len:191 (-) Transcript_159676:56-628(-)